MADFTVGCELEVTLELHKVKAVQGPQIKDLVGFAEYLVSKYERLRGRDQLAMQSDVEGVAEVGNRWSLTDDVTIETSSNNQWPIEVVSPVLFHRPDGEWMGQIMALFQNLNRLCSIKTNRSCGFHVHFSPVDGWNPETVKALSRAVIYFEPAFEAILPVERRRNEYAKSNRFDNSGLRGKSGQEIFQAIDNCTHAVHVADLLNDGGDRYYGWNLTNLYFGRIQTIEFRREPGVHTYGECVGWIECVLGFARATLSVSPSELQQHTQDVAGLWSFITKNPAANVDILRPLFGGHSGSLTPQRVGDIAPAKRQNLERKKAQADAKNLISLKMRYLFGS